MTKTLREQRRKAYDAGWRASTQGRTGLDQAERRFGSRNPDPSDMFAAGWIDYGCGDRDKYHSLRREHPEDFA